MKRRQLYYLWLSLAFFLTPRGSVLGGETANSSEVFASAKDENIAWSSYVQTFRRNHHFALTLVSTSASWHYQYTSQAQPQTYSTRGVGSKFEYSFRIPLTSRFGYLLGSSCGFNYEDTQESSLLAVGPIWRLPGIVAGMMWSFSPRLNLLVTYENYMERLEGFAQRDRDNPVRLKTSMRANYDLGYIFELYSHLFWGTRFEYHQREIVYVPPQNPSGEARLEEVKMYKIDRWLGIGVVYHLL